MNTKQLKSFIKVAENKNFTRTAEELFISQPTLTQQIRSLEEDIGFDLFIRTNKLVELTDAGLFFYERAKVILTMIDSAAEDGRKISTSNFNNITLGYFRPFSKHLIPSIIKDFNQKNKECSINLFLSNSNQLYKALLERKVDIIFISKNMVKSDNKALVFKPLFTTNLGFIIREDSKLSRKEVISFNDLANLTVLLPNHQTVTNTYLELEEAIRKNVPTCTIKYIEDYDLGISTLRGFPSTITVCPDIKSKYAQDLVYRPFETIFTEQYGLAYLDYSKDMNKIFKKIIDASQIVLKKEKLI